MAVLITAILASMALPQYQKTVERGYWRSAQDLLQTIYAGEQIYWTNNEFYIDPETAPATWLDIYLDNPNLPGRPTPSKFLVTDVTASTFTATAARGDGRCMSLDESNTLVFSSSAGGCTSAWSIP